MHGTNASFNGPPETGYNNAGGSIARLWSDPMNWKGSSKPGVLGNDAMLQHHCVELEMEIQLSNITRYEESYIVLILCYTFKVLYFTFYKNVFKTVKTR